MSQTFPSLSNLPMSPVSNQPPLQGTDSLVAGCKVHKLKKNFKLRFDGLSKLETLENFTADWCEVKDLPKLINLQKLTVTVMNYDVEMMKYLASIPYPCLRYLALSIFPEKLALPDGPDILRKLLCDQNYILQESFIVGPLPEMAQVFGQQLHNSHADVSLVRITCLKLCSSSTEEDPMPVLEKIPMLYEERMGYSATLLSFLNPNLQNSALRLQQIQIWFIVRL
ncbi:hypothetical protein AgCh_023675 [Apium graveolens]